MPNYYRKASHTVYDIKFHIVFCVSVGEITEEMIKEYIESHINKDNFTTSDDEL